MQHVINYESSLLFDSTENNYLAELKNKQRWGIFFKQSSKKIKILEIIIWLDYIETPIPAIHSHFTLDTETPMKLKNYKR